MKYLPLDAALFIENRRRFVRQMDKNAIAIFNSNDELPMNGDALYKFKQNSDLYWLTGIDQEDPCWCYSRITRIRNSGRYWCS